MDPDLERIASVGYQRPVIIGVITGVMQCTDQNIIPVVFHDRIHIRIKIQSNFICLMALIQIDLSGSLIKGRALKQIPVNRICLLNKCAIRSRRIPLILVIIRHITIIKTHFGHFILFRIEIVTASLIIMRRIQSVPCSLLSPVLIHLIKVPEPCNMQRLCCLINIGDTYKTISCHLPGFLIRQADHDMVILPISTIIQGRCLRRCLIKFKEIDRNGKVTYICCENILRARNDRKHCDDHHDCHHDRSEAFPRCFREKSALQLLSYSFLISHFIPPHHA